ncbi:hypothetical protein MSP7336_03552 [Mycobacterium shimoidei]|uniref:L,D-TPase catalytic domain-containing protein n=1 Tax=Mycobacterium shimoidei TaxID=29313 RepID=A0A375Z2A2_MYCSH|nr:L,D-transpeptidase [Mycobacterium shimoidei]SRX95288.1 hypothetical protein MSP7336_03552 [Mycobacterium shimoidei]
MSGWTEGSPIAALKAAGVAAILGLLLVLGAGPVLAEPDPDPAPSDPGVVAPPAGPPAPPPIGAAPFGPPTIVPANGATVGVAQPILINFPGLVDDAGATESAVHITSVPPVDGKFYWQSPTQLRWRPLNFWPAHTEVTVDAGGTVSSFHTGDTLVATADDATHQLTVTRNGSVEKTIPMSMGMASGGHQTPNGTFYVLEKLPSVVMDSSTYGVPVSSANGYRLTVDHAVKFDNSGDFVHSAPWSVDDQGKRDVSHGCINISPTNAKWFFDTVSPGDPIIVTNSTGTYTRNDGSNDWQN